MDFYPIWLLAQITSDRNFIITPPWFWLIAGVILTTSEFLLAKKLPSQYKFIALSMAASAFITSIVVWQMTVRLGIDWNIIMYEDFGIQILYWMGVCFACIIWVRPTLIKRKKFVIPDATEAKTVTDILPGENGQVLYEGCFWQARCADKTGAIASNQKVYVLHREGNTLIVAPETMFNS
ncbi:NfeD family protein [Planktothrix sp. FACHB-1355]|uniref:NfeD family protein n=1 Tax=Aerosakkonema funiforme FACHB-1375 TaxID=2949571 RepID=A0A926ZI66_9CYAN|nr:NfeD family protein [Aerosakkonema funiforme]MBD2184103.1 NfeD family protein [Aerosakkonema funiforme FACHB-1375]MBD3557843.1 NfeD family protein [Planktothrix sp. FACHB-1355]